MKVKLDVLTSAMSKIRKFAEGQKNVPGVMLDISGDKMKVCYSDGKKSIVEVIDIEQEEPGVQGRIVVPYAKITSIIDICQPSGPIITGDLDIAFYENNIIEITAIKKVKLISDTENEEEEQNVEEKMVSKFEQRLNYYKPEDSIQYQVLARMDYDSIFEGDNPDVWDKEDLRNKISRLSTEKSKVVYVSAHKRAAFVVNLAHVTNIPIDSCENNGMTLTTFIASALVDILGKMNGDKVAICVKDNRYANITSEDNTVGIWFEMAPASKTDVATLKRYEDKTYNKYQLTFCRPAIQNVIACAMATDANEKTTISFVEAESGELAIKIITNTGGSVVNDFNVVMENYRDSVGDILNAKIPVSLKVLYDMLGNCQEYYIAFDIANDDAGTYIRVADIVEVDDNGYPTQLGITHYTVSAR